MKLATAARTIAVVTFCAAPAFRAAAEDRARERLPAEVPAPAAPEAGAAVPLPLDGLVASVNGETITIADVMRELPAVMGDVRKRPDAPRDGEALFRAAFREALDSLVDRRLVVQKYWAGEQRIPPHAIDRTTAEILEDRYGGNLQNLLADLASDRMTYAEWRDKMEERMIVASMRHGYADGSAHVSPAEISRAYEARKKELVRTERVKVRLASFSGADAAEAAADAALACGDGGGAAAFDSLAAAGTPGVSVQDMGFVDPAADLAPSLAAACAALEDGEVSPPVELGGSAFLLFREATEGAGVRPLSEVWDEIRSELLAEKKAALFKAWIRHLRNDAVITESLPFD